MSDEEEIKSLTTQLPKVIEEGKEVIRPDIIQAVTQLAQLGQLVKIRRSLQKREFQGKVDTRTLEVTDEIKHIGLINNYPNHPWISAFFINDGPDTVYIGINNPYEWVEIEKDETRTIDYTHADERIRKVYYKCDPGETASVRVEGHY